MILVYAADNFRKFWKIQKIIIIYKSIKICHKQNVKCLVFFKWPRQVCNHLYLNAIKTTLKTLIFFKKLIFAFSNPKIVKWLKTPLNFSPLQCTYLGKNSFQYHLGLVRKKAIEKWLLFSVYLYILSGNKIGSRHQSACSGRTFCWDWF